MYKKLILSKLLLTTGIFVLSLGARAQESTISKSELPKKAQTFLSDNFASQKILQAVKDKDYFSKTKYEVYLDKNVKVEFDADGNWEEVDGNDAAIPTRFVPKKIQEYVSKNFPTYKISKIEKDPAKYEVELTNGIDLEFSSKGDFLRIDD